MARGDSISDGDVDVAQNTAVEVKPASGDEWLITSMNYITTGNKTFDTEDSGGGHACTIIPPGGTAAVTDPENGHGPNMMTKMIFTNTQYFQITENNTAATKFGYMGVKIKD
jgi:hypothetical protein